MFINKIRRFFYSTLFDNELEVYVSVCLNNVNKNEFRNQQLELLFPAERYCLLLASNSYDIMIFSQ